MPNRSCPKSAYSHLIFPIVVFIPVMAFTVFSLDKVRSWTGFWVFVFCGVLSLICTIVGITKFILAKRRDEKRTYIHLISVLVFFFTFYCQATPQLITPSGYHFPSAEGWQLVPDEASARMADITSSNWLDWQGNRFARCYVFAITNVVDPSGQSWCLQSSTNGGNYRLEVYYITNWMSTASVYSFVPSNCIVVISDASGRMLSTNWGRIGSNLKTSNPDWLLSAPVQGNKSYRLLSVETIPHPQLVWCVIVVVVIAVGLYAYVSCKAIKCITNILDPTNCPRFPELDDGQ